MTIHLEAEQLGDEARRARYDREFAEKDRLIGERDQAIIELRGRLEGAQSDDTADDTEIARLRDEVTRLQNLLNAGGGSGGEDPDEEEPPPIAARFGTHWPARTPRPSANDPVVDCTWPAINAKIRELAPGAAIAVRPGTLAGAGAGSTLPGQLSNLDKGLAARTLIYPADGYGTVSLVTKGSAFVNVKGLAFVGIKATGLSALFNNSWNCAWAWSEIDYRRVTARASQSAGDIDWVECVSRGTAYASDDRHRFVTAGSAASTMKDIRSIGCYDSSMYRPIGSDSHTDLYQVERQTGGGTIEGIHFKDTIGFGTHSQTLMFAGIPGVTFDNTAWVGGLANERRYPRDLSKTTKHQYVPRTFAGEGHAELRRRTVVAGAIAEGWTFKTSATPNQVDELVRFSYMNAAGDAPDPVKMDELYAWLDRDHPEPTDAELAAGWNIGRR